MSNRETIDNLEAKLADSITSENLIDLTIEIGESFLDVVMQDGIAQNIPVFGSIYKLGKAGLGIREHYFAKKVFIFLTNIKNVPIEDRTKFLHDLEKYNYGQKAGETLITLLERFDHSEKPIILSNLLKARVAEKIDIVEFLRLSSIVERSFLPDVKKLSDYNNRSKRYNGHECESLNSLGLIYQCMEDANGINNLFTITSLGADLLKYGLA